MRTARQRREEPVSQKAHRIPRGLERCLTCSNFGSFNDEDGPLDAFIFCATGGKKDGDPGHIYVSKARRCEHPIPKTR